MRLAVWIAALVLACAPAAAAAQTPADPGTAAAKAELRQMWRDLNTARRARDQPALEAIYAPEFLFVHTYFGGIVTRAETIKGLMASPPDADLPMPDFDRIRLYDDVAILRTTEPDRFSTAIYARREGRWRIVELQGTPLPPARAAIELPAPVLAAYAGRYEQAPGRVATVTPLADGLQVTFPNAVVWRVRPLSETHFFLPASMNQILFHRGADGRVAGYTAWLATGAAISARKLD